MPYISPNLTHFVGRGKPQQEQYALLISVLRSGLLAPPPYDPNHEWILTVNYSHLISGNEMYMPDMVCFCDIPASDLSIHTSKYSKFGVAFPKPFLIPLGANPVFYVSQNSVVRDLTVSGNSESNRANYFNQMVPRTVERLDEDPSNTAEMIMAGPFSYDESVTENPRLQALAFLERDVFSFVKVFDDSLAEDDPNNYYMEREWRVFGNVHFSLDDVICVFIPSSFVDQLHSDLPDFVGTVHGL